MPENDLRDCVLVLAPIGRDAILIRDTLEHAGVRSHRCRDAQELAGAIRATAGAAVIAEEALDPACIGWLGDALGGQPPWSDLPVIVLSSGGESTRATNSRLLQLGPLGNVTVVERPVRPATLVSVARTALRARGRQYEVEQLLEEQKRSTELLAEQARALRQSNEDLQRFAYIASHDLQEPLRMIGSYSQLLVRKNAGRLDEDSQQFARYIVTGVERMRTLIRDLLEFSRVTSEGGTTPAPVDCNGVLGLALQHLQFKINESGASITFDRLPVVLGHETRLLLVFQNLIDNALKYSRTAPQVHISAQREGQFWRISIRDEGIGIAPEYQEKIFGLFQRLHSREEYPGTGIGLATCRRIVEQHGGRIWVESAKEQGSTFCFTLPGAE